MFTAAISTAVASTSRHLAPDNSSLNDVPPKYSKIIFNEDLTSTLTTNFRFDFSVPTLVLLSEPLMLFSHVKSSQSTKQKQMLTPPLEPDNDDDSSSDCSNASTKMVIHITKELRIFGVVPRTPHHD